MLVVLISAGVSGCGHRFRGGARPEVSAVRDSDGLQINVRSELPDREFRPIQRGKPGDDLWMTAHLRIYSRGRIVSESAHVIGYLSFIHSTLAPLDLPPCTAPAGGVAAYTWRVVRSAAEPQAGRPDDSEALVWFGTEVVAIPAAAEGCGIEENSG